MQENESVSMCLLDLVPIQDVGHLSYACPKNILGDRDPPKKKEKKKKKKGQQPDHVYVFNLFLQIGLFTFWILTIVM